MKKLIFFLSILLIISCSKDDVCDTTPSLSTPTIVETFYSSVKISGSVKGKECDLGVISKGIVISKDELPTVNTSIIRRNISNDKYDISIENLETKTKYYIRTFLINNEGEFYGSQSSFTTLNEDITFSDINADNISFSSVTLKGSFQFAEGNGHEVKSKGIVLTRNNIENEDLNSSGNSIKVNIDDLDHNSDYNYYLYVDTNYGKFKSELNSFKTISANSIFGEISISDLTYRGVKISVEYETEYDTDEITTVKGIEICRDDDCKKHDSNETEKIISLEIDTLRANTKYRVIPYIGNEYSYQTIGKEFTTLESPFEIGQEDKGGVIAWLDYTGWRGIAVASKDMIKKLQWSDELNSSNDLDLHYNYEKGVNGITAYESTKKIIDYYSNISETAPAAEYVWNLEYSGYSDWHMPNNSDFQKINWYLNRLRQNDSSNSMYDPNSKYYFDYLGDDAGAVWFWLATAFESGTTTKGNKAMVRKFYSNSDQFEKDKYYWVMPIRRFNY
ncbi:hypothetical protein OAD59_00710 [Flavobacteriaceae bacterium]|nr:hypothetical protein [Flavobacteriaceae bacterium]